MERLDDAAKAIINECVEANKKVTNVKHSFEVEKKEDVNEASVLGKIKDAVMAVVEKFKNKIASKFAKIDAENQKLKALLAKVK
jgi:DNA polymerase II small subunit/DNA polymerase delta subunit B